jgi:hypothetical protein
LEKFMNTEIETKEIKRKPMSSEDSKKNWTAHLPGILTGSAAFIAALTTVFINVRSDKSSSPTVMQAAPVATAILSAAVPLSQPVAAPPVSQVIELKLARLRVDNDGTLGSTDWTFDIQTVQRSLFSVPFKTLTDKAGDNLVAPSEPALAHATLVLKAGEVPDIIVRGWKQTWSGKAELPDVIGKAKLNADDGSLVVEAKSEKTGGPAFVLYFDTRLLKSN